MLATDRPFVLLDDAGVDRATPARLFRAPVEVLAAGCPDELPGVLAGVAGAAGRGLHVAGWLAYEAGFVLEPKLAPLAQDGLLAWFGLFEQVERIAAADVPELLPPPEGAWAGEPRPRIDRAGYGAAYAEVQAHIRAGDIYQANLTFRADVPVAGDPRALYAALRGRAAAPWSALVWTGERWLLSLSPELFFRIDGDTVSARPMKGTALRGDDAAADRIAAEALAADPKQRAENLMIVDLLRNDLARVAEPGSVRVPALFTVETYPTLHTLTSTVTAILAAGKGAADVLAAIFPCGSVTGAPKIRAQQVIAAVEAGPRGAYTGSIGYIEPGGDAAFNVAIRTLDWRPGEPAATLGLGSGVVADSDEEGEWRECLAKAAFLGGARRRFDLIETMRFDPEEGLLRLEGHLARMKASAEVLGFAFDRHGARNELQAATFRLRSAAKVRLLLARSGAVAIETGPLPAAAAEPMPVALVRRDLPADDLRLRHKTSLRAPHDAARAAGGTAEIVWVDDAGFCTEGSWSTLFVERDGRLLTPPLSRGLLPGVLRAELIAVGRAVEAELTPADLAGGFQLGNALRGLWSAAVAKEAIAL